MKTFTTNQEAAAIVDAFVNVPTATASAENNIQQAVRVAVVQLANIDSMGFRRIADEQKAVRMIASVAAAATGGALSTDEIRAAGLAAMNLDARRDENGYDFCPEGECGACDNEPLACSNPDNAETGGL